MANITGNTTQKPIGTLTHKTVYIDPSTLNNAITSWLEESTDTQDRSTHANPVLLVALHACGSLTPSILKTFVSLSSRGSSINALPSSSVRWEPRAAVIVGCCYNMMAAEGTILQSHSHPHTLTLNHIRRYHRFPPFENCGKRLCTVIQFDSIPPSARCANPVALARHTLRKFNYRIGRS